jgi:UDPglucose 6-dehydrogenase
VIGTDDAKVEEVMRKLYEPFVRTGKPILVMDPASAELTKYAANAMLGRAHLVHERDRELLRPRRAPTCGTCAWGWARTAASAPRSCFPGVGYGGSCFPKDVKALIRMGQDAGCVPERRRSDRSARTRRRRRCWCRAWRPTSAGFGASASPSGGWRSSRAPTTCARRRRSP